MKALRRFWKQLVPTQESEAPKPEIALTSERILLEKIEGLISAERFVDAVIELESADIDITPTVALLRSRAFRLAGRYLEADREVAVIIDHRAATAHDLACAYHESAQVALSRSDVQGAIDALNVALSFSEEIAAVWYLLGECWARLAQHQECLACFGEAAKRSEASKDRARAWFQIGQAHMFLVEVEQAYSAFERALSLDEQLIPALIGLGNASLWLDKEPEATRHFESAVQQSESPGRLLLLNLGIAYQYCGRFEEARSIFSRMVAEYPNDQSVRWYLCQLDLALCYWVDGWRNYSSRFLSRAANYRPTPFRPWDGRPDSKATLLVLADEGIGDEIMYASCLEDASRRVGHVVLECEPRLEKLFSRSFPFARVVASDRAVNAEWLDRVQSPDWQISSGDLPSHFRKLDSDFPSHTGYLRADPERARFWKSRLDLEFGTNLKIGISWRGGTIKTRMRARSLEGVHWQPILSCPNASFVNLQYGKYEDELSSLNASFNNVIRDFPEAISDYDETAALVSALDVVVTVCTAIVHLAGALGKPVWVLTPYSAGWRYTANRSSMPWYPSSRLFRQHAYGEWDQACHNVSVALRDLTKMSHPGL